MSSHWSLAPYIPRRRVPAWAEACGCTNRMGHSLTCLHGLALAKCCSQQCPQCRTHRNTSTASHAPSSSGTGRDRESLVQRIRGTLQVHKHMQFMDHPSTAPPLCPLATLAPIAGPLARPMGSWSSLGLTSKHTLIAQALCSHRSPEIAAQTLCPPDTFDWTQSLLLTSWYSLEFAGELHMWASALGKVQMLSPC